MLTRTTDHYNRLRIQPKSTGRTEGRRFSSFPWHMPAAVRELNYALLSAHFHITLDIPLDTLCPPVSSRLDYLLHVRDELRRREPPDGPLQAIDVGTGASCIYPLLGVRAVEEWLPGRGRMHFTALETDARSYQYAAENVRQNGLAGSIQVLSSENAHGPILEPCILANKGKPPIHYAFLVCNPPFYTDPETRHASAADKCRAPTSTCTAASHELYTPGGEVAFVRRLVQEGRALSVDATGAPISIHLHTCLLGHKRSVEEVRVLLEQQGATGIRFQSMKHGHTMRWIAMWSWA
jgi:23S rRNA A1618 N6-methylase RlmF